MGSSPERAPLAFSLMAKPSGPKCNLDCQYCFYLEKEKLYPGVEKSAGWKMSESVLETYIRDYIESQDVPTVNFAWQGGEPTLLGIDFFRRAVEIEKKYAGGKQIDNSFQTNGVLIDGEWAKFLADNKFLVGISIDGPPRSMTGIAGTGVGVRPSTRSSQQLTVSLNTVSSLTL